jgi:hypothetical protein
VIPSFLKNKRCRSVMFINFCRLTISTLYSSSISLVTSNNNRVLLDSNELNAASGVSLSIERLNTRCDIMMLNNEHLFYCAPYSVGTFLLFIFLR